MEFERTTMAQLVEIQRLIDSGHSDRAVLELCAVVGSR